MKTTWFMVIRYLISGEASGAGRMDFWNGVYLIRKTPFQRHCLELSKVFFLIALSTSIMMALAHWCA